MRLAAHQDRDSRRLCRRCGKHHCRRGMTVHDQRGETAGPDVAPKPRRNNRQEPGPARRAARRRERTARRSPPGGRYPIGHGVRNLDRRRPAPNNPRDKARLCSRPTVDSDAGKAARHTESDACAGTQSGSALAFVMPRYPIRSASACSGSVRTTPSPASPALRSAIAITRRNAVS